MAYTARESDFRKTMITSVNSHYIEISNIILAIMLNKYLFKLKYANNTE